MITKKIKYFLIFIMLLSIGNLKVLANTNIIDFSKTGTVEVTLKEITENIPIKGAELTIYQIASVSSKDNKLTYTYLENITDCQADLSNLENENLSSEIDKCINNIELPIQIKKTDCDGIAKFDNLKLGLYLIKQTNKVEGYSSISSFLVAIPKTIDNKWTYDIKATPKTDIIKVIDLSVEKVWNDSSKFEAHPKSVTIELYKEEELIDTVILNEENNWKHTWLDLEKSDKYSVKEINIPAGYTDNYRQEGNKFIVTNTKTLVQTGMNLWFIELLAVLGLVFITTGIICEKRKKYE